MLSGECIVTICARKLLPERLGLRFPLRYASPRTEHLVRGDLLNQSYAEGRRVLFRFGQGPAPRIQAIRPNSLTFLDPFANMPSTFLALVGVSLFDPETALRFRRRETRRPCMK